MIESSQYIPLLPIIIGLIAALIAFPTRPWRPEDDA